MAHLRGYVDDDAAAFGDHQPGRRLRHKKCRPDIECQELIEGRFVDFEKGLRSVEPGIVDQDVEVAEADEGVVQRYSVGDVERQHLLDVEIVEVAVVRL